MNKKFSTLVAGILLAGSLPVAAQYCPINGEIAYRSREVKAATLDKGLMDVYSINENYYYQLQVNPASLSTAAENSKEDYVLTVERDYSTGKLYLTAQKVTEATLTHSLWQIKVQGREVNSRVYKYVNKETGFELTFDHTNAIKVTNGVDDQGGAINGYAFDGKSNPENWNYEANGLLDGCNKWWAWYTTEDQNFNPLTYKRVYSYFHNTDSVMMLHAVSLQAAPESGHCPTDLTDRVYGAVGNNRPILGLSENGLNGTANGGYAIVPMKDSKANAQDYMLHETNILQIRPVVAGAKVLDANEINTMIDADRSYLDFSRGRGVDQYNYWDDAELDKNIKPTLFTKMMVCKPGSKELLSIADGANPFLADFVAEQHLYSTLNRTKYASQTTTEGSPYAGYNILFREKDPRLVADDGSELYDYLYVHEHNYEATETGEYNALKVVTQPYATLVATGEDGKRKIWNDYAHRSVNPNNPNTTVTSFPDALEARYLWKVTYYATNDSLVLEPLNASRMPQAEMHNALPFEKSQLADDAAEEWFNTINEGLAYSTNVIQGNNMINKAAGVPVALYAVNNSSVGDNARLITVGVAANKEQDLNASETKWKARCKFDDVTTAAERNNPAYVTNWLDAVGTATKDNAATYQSQMKLVIRFANNYTYLKRSTVKDGVYFINLAKAGTGTTLTENRVKGAYLVDDMKGHLVYDVAQDEQDFTHMPATQWVVEQEPCRIVEGAVNVNDAPVVTIRNREFDNADSYAFRGQLYVDAEGNLFTINHRYYGRKFLGTQTVDDHTRYAGRLSCADLMNFNKLQEVNTLGYFNEKEDVLRENVYQFQNMYDFGRYRFLGIDDLNAEMDTLKLLENGGTQFELFTVKDWKATEVKYTTIVNGKEVKKSYEPARYAFSYTDSVEYGYESEIAGAPQLYATTYKIKLKDTNLIDNDHRFVAINNQHKYVVAKESDIENPANHLHYAVVTLKENNHMEGEHCYAILNAPSYTLVNGYNEAQLQFLRRDSKMTPYGYAVTCYWNDDNGNGKMDESEIRVMEDVNTAELSGKLVVEGTTLDAKIADKCETTSSVFALVQVGRPLYATLGAEYVNALDKCLDLRTIDEQGNEHLYEETVGEMNYLGVENLTEDNKNTGFYVDYVAKSTVRMPQYLLAVAADSVPAYRWCNELLPSGQPKHGVNQDCGHDEEYPGYVEGRFLVNFNDSVKAALIDKQTNADKFKSDGYTRLGFKTAVHRGDYLYILNEGKNLNDYKVASEDPAENGRLYLKPTFFSKDNEGADKVWTAVKLDGTHNNVAFSLRNTGDTDESVMIESNYDGESQIGSFSGAWIKIINNVPVLAKYYNNNGNHNTGDTTDSWKGENDRVSSDNNGEFINQGARFLFTAIDKSADATANEEVAAADVTVIATQGAIIVKGAAGKVITVANVLGQTIANQVAASDNVTIAAPAGIVVVSVDGEATKVVVK